MYYSILHLNYFAVVVAAIAGLLIGWLWYSPALFAKPWMAEMKISEDMMKTVAEKGMAGFFIRAFGYTLLSTFALAVLISSRASITVLKGVGIGAFVGLLLVGMRFLNAGVWEQRSATLLAIVVGHEIMLFTAQGAILGAWL